MGENTRNAEIAFFGGSFTAIDREYMLSLLEAAKPYINSFKGIRISTRPDYIDDDILILLKKYNVTTIELGAQSMRDEVLAANSRDHTAHQVREAFKLIKSYGFNAGLQMMTGLYKATPELDMLTAKEFVKLNPDCVRVYPTVVIKDTELAGLFKSGEYNPYTLEESVELCADILKLFYDNNIDVIRVGLHYSDSLVKNSLFDNYHPAFKELCESKILFDNVKNQLTDYKNIKIYVNPASVSKLVGQKRSNIIELDSLGYSVSVDKDPSLLKYEVRVEEQR